MRPFSKSRTFQARISLAIDERVLFAAGVTTDMEDSSVYTVMVVDGALGMGSREDYLSDDKEAIRAAYLVYVADSLELMGIPAKEAAANARLILKLERRIAAQKLTPVENMDPKNQFTRMSMTELSSLISKPTCAGRYFERPKER